VAGRKRGRPAAPRPPSWKRILRALVYLACAALVVFLALLFWPGDPAALHLERLFAERSPMYFPVGTFTLLSGLIAAAVYWLWRKAARRRQERERERHARPPGPSGRKR
jgi:hypothetical protein